MRKFALFSIVVLLTACLSESKAQTERKPEVRKDLAESFGKVLGAASRCPNITFERIKNVREKATEVLRALAVTPEEASTLVRDLDLIEGLESLSNEKTTCLETERELEKVSATLGRISQSSQQLPSMAHQQSEPIPSVLTGGNTQGITNTEIRFGIIAPFTGPSREFGPQLKKGIESAFRTVNDAGGIYGRMLKLYEGDDGYEVERTPEVLKELYEKQQIFAMIGNVGTPEGAITVPFCLEKKMLFFAPFPGSGVFRRNPPDRYVFNYRASYAEETAAAINYLVKFHKLKPDQIAAFTQQDAYGDSGYAGVTKAVRTLFGGDGSQVLRVGHKRNTVDVDEAIVQIKAHKPQIKAVVMVSIYRAAAKFIEKTRSSIPGLTYINVSAVESSSLRDELMLLGGKYAKGVIVTQVVPSIDSHSSLVLEYKAALGKYFAHEAPDLVSLQGYIQARILIEALRRAGRDLDTEKVVDVLDNMRDYDIGLGVLINFSRSDHQAIHKIWATQLNEDGIYEDLVME
jgi:ABC-type branched-subunit amino acid transport system substrate-binding protein